MKIICFLLLLANSALANTVLITGANSGIGFALVNKFLKEKYNVIATYRNDNNSKELLDIKNKNLSLIKVDLLNKKASLVIKEKVGDHPIDILINNACFYPYKVSKINEKLSTQEWLDTFLVCSIQPIQISETLLANIAKSDEKKIIMIGSRISSTTLNTSTDNHYNNGYGYKSAKAALHSASVILAKDFKKKNIGVVILHPGRVLTKIISAPNGTELSPDNSAQKMFDIIKKIKILDSMKFINEEGKELPF